MANASIFTVGGTVQAGSGLYLSRKVDETLLELCRDGSFAYVLTARQMGKSSLMIRTAERLAEQGTRSAIIDLSQIGVQIEEEAWYLGFIIAITRRLKLRTNIFAWWKAQAHLGYAQRMTQFFQDILLEEITDPVVIFIDEIDTTLSLPFTDDFFAAIRSVYNARSSMPAFKRLSFILIGVATPNDLISDPRRTPFNIGRQVDVGYFTEEEALPLAVGFNHPEEDARRLLRDVLSRTEGHPYLTQRLCSALAEEGSGKMTKKDLDRIVAATFYGVKSEEDSNLRFVHDMLTRRAAAPEAVLTLYEKILAGRRVRDDKHSSDIAHLKLSGLVRQSKGALRVSNPIYAAVFNRAWVKDQWPEHWIKRVPPTVIALVAVLFVAVILLGLFFMQTQRASEARRQSAIQEQLNTELSNQVHISDSLRAVEATINAQLSDQVRVSDSLRRVTEAVNTQLTDQVQVSASLNTQLSDQVRVSDSLRQVTEAVNTRLTDQVQVSDSLRTVAEERLVEAQQARLETITIALASKAVRQVKLGDAALGALLARQAFQFAQAGEGEFLNPVYDALVQALNALGDDGASVAGPEVITDHQAGVRAVAYSPDGRWIASAGDDGIIRLWSNETATLRRLQGHRAAVRSLAFSPDGTALASGGDDRTVLVWRNLDAARPEREQVGEHLGAVWAVAFAPDGGHLASAGADRTLWVRDLQGRAEPAWMNVSVGVRIPTLAFSPDGAVLAFGREEGTVQLWAWREPGSQPVIWDAGQGRLHALTFNPSGDVLASAGDSATVRFWRVGQPGDVPEAGPTLRGHEGPVNALAFSTDGKTLASGSSDHSVQVWNVERLDLSPILLQEHSSWVQSLAFNPDGTRLASGSADRTVRLWNVEPDRMAASICTVVAGRELSPEEWDQYVGEDFPYERDYQPCSSTAAERARPGNNNE